MVSLVLAFILFSFFVLIGLAVLFLFKLPVSPIKGFLISPVLGYSILILIVYVLNQAGIPVKNCGPWVGLFLLLMSSFVFIKFKPSFSWRQLSPFIVIAFFTLLYLGWPAFYAGLSWTGWSNLDFSNYCRAATRFLNYGFYDIPTEIQYAGTDLTQQFWNFHVVYLSRCGAEMLLAWLSSVLPITTVQSFMPTILALAVSQVFSLCALMQFYGAPIEASIAAGVLLAISPLFSLGTYMQLIAQVGGLGLMLVLCALLTEGIAESSVGILIRKGFLISIFCASLGIFYPEVIPFVVLSCAFYWILKWVNNNLKIKNLVAAKPPLRTFFKRSDVLKTILITSSILAGVMILLRQNILSVIFTLLVQVRHGTASASLELCRFPFFLVPSGFANLFGLLPISQYPSEPILSICILAGGAFLFILFIFALSRLNKPHPIICLFIIMVIVGLKLILGYNDFGIFKLSMFVQPALAGVIALLISKFSIKGVIYRIAIAVIFFITLPTFINYSRTSIGYGITGVFELSSKGGERFKLEDKRPVFLDFNDIVAAGVVSNLLIGNKVIAPSRNFFGLKLNALSFLNLDLSLMYGPQRGKLYRKIGDEIDKFGAYNSELWGSQFWVNPSELSQISKEPSPFLISMPKTSSIVNGSKSVPYFNDTGFYKIGFLNDVQNRLIFIHSSRGNHFYLGELGKISLFPSEPDYFSDRGLTGVGEFLLFRVLNPTDRFRVRLSLTNSLFPKGHRHLPSSAVILGEKTYLIGLKGSGSASIITEPLKPFQLGSGYYIALDLKEEGSFLPVYRSGLMKLFNEKVNLDFRKLVSFGRDISAYSEDEYQNLKRPTELYHFPQDLLTQTGLEFSGLYEDGWLSPIGFILLGECNAGDQIVFKGEIPAYGKFLKFANILRVKLNSSVEKKFTFSAGKFEIVLPILNDSKMNRFDFKFENVDELPNSDGRIVGAKIISIAIRKSSR